MLNDQTSLAAAMICLSAEHRAVPYPPCLSFLPASLLPYVVPVWPADVSGLTNALTPRLTLIYFLWNLGAEGNNTEWHYLFIKSKVVFLGRVKMWRLDTTPPTHTHICHTHFPPTISDCTMISRSCKFLNLIQQNDFEIWQSKNEAIKLLRFWFNPTLQFVWPSD